MSGATALATAALMEMIARGQQLQAAIIRGDPPEEIERIRQEGMAVAEGYLDRTAEAARAVRSMVDDLPNADELRADGARRLLE